MPGKFDACGTVRDIARRHDAWGGRVQPRPHAKTRHSVATPSMLLALCGRFCSLRLPGSHGPTGPRFLLTAMRICLVTPYDLTHDGGVNRHVRALAHALRRSGHAVRVLGPTSGVVPAGCDGLRGVAAIPANGSIARVGLYVPRHAVGAYLDAGGFDVVHVHEPSVPGPSRHACGTRACRSSRRSTRTRRASHSPRALSAG